MSNRLYNVLKHVSLYVLPASVTLYVALANVWHFGYVDQVVASIGAVNAFLGAIVGASSAMYKPPADAHLVVDDSDPEKTRAQLDLSHSDPQEMVRKDFLTVKVVHPQQDTTPAPPRSL